MSNFLSRNISTIFIMLGHECNLQCKYCLQHDVVNVAMERQVNPMLYNFIIVVLIERKEYEKNTHTYD